MFIGAYLKCVISDGDNSTFFEGYPLIIISLNVLKLIKPYYFL